MKGKVIIFKQNIEKGGICLAKWVSRMTTLIPIYLYSICFFLFFTCKQVS